MFNEASTLLLSLCVGTAIVVRRWLRLRRRLRSAAITTGEARAQFNTFAIVQLTLFGSVYYWILLFAMLEMPESIFKDVSGHNFYGVPFAGLIGGACFGVVVGAIGGSFLRVNAQNAN